MLTLVFGIPGVGKTTVLNEVLKLLPDLKIEKFGSIELRIAVELGMAKDRDDLRKLDIVTQKKLQYLASEEINHLHDQHKNLIIDTHAAVKTDQGYWPGFSEILLKKIQPQAFVLIECDPEIILRHRITDSTRRRDDDSLKAIEQHQMIDRSFAATYATMTNGVTLILENKEGDPSYAASRIASLF